MNSIQSIIQALQKDQILLFAIPIFLLSALIEWYLAKDQMKDLYVKKDFLVSISMGILSSIVEFLPKVLAFYIFYNLHEITPLRDVVERQWWAWIALFFLDDFAYYWNHRMNHEVRLFWAGHVPHHSSVKFNFGTALRQGVGERVHKFIWYGWIPLLGFDPLMMFTMMGLNLIYQFFVHTDLVY
ncbi:MAG: sterol desaturase family protein, partial [Bacteroidota bacterium]